MSASHCVTLDTNSGEDSKKETVKMGRKTSEVVRCNFCVEPGWLSVNQDAKKHRQLVHSSALFYCDTCEDGEPGAVGFETFKEAPKHVVKENGIDPTDKANIYELIRIPSSPDSLKLLRCTFCSGEGFKFVGLSEEECVKHVKNKHGVKALRSRPDKLKRECRVCGTEYGNDDDLTRHVERRHLRGGRDNRFPFGGFGPRTKKSREDEDERTLRMRRSEFMDEDTSGRRKTSTPKHHADICGGSNSKGREGRNVESGSQPDARSREKETRSNKKNLKQEVRSRSSSCDEDKRIKFERIIGKERIRASSSSSDEAGERFEKRMKRFHSSSSIGEHGNILKTEKKTVRKRALSSSSSSKDDREMSKRKKKESSSSSEESEGENKFINRVDDKSWSPNDIRWLQLTDQFLSKVCNKKKPKLYEHLYACNFCHKSVVEDMAKHMSEKHQDKIFLCCLCEEVFPGIEQARDHLKQEHDRTDDVKSLLKTGLLQPPPFLMSVLCQFCRPQTRIVPSSSETDNFMYEVYKHMDKHEDEHKGIEKEIKLATVYSCRICTGRVWKDLQSLAEHVSMNHENVEVKEERKLGPAEKRKESHWGREDKQNFGGYGGKIKWSSANFGEINRSSGHTGKIRNSVDNREMQRSSGYGGEMKKSSGYGGEIKRNLLRDRQYKSAIKIQGNESRVPSPRQHTSTTLRQKDVKDLLHSKNRTQYHSYPSKSSKNGTECHSYPSKSSKNNTECQSYPLQSSKDRIDNRTKSSYQKGEYCEKKTRDERMERETGKREGGGLAKSLGRSELRRVDRGSGRATLSSKEDKGRTNKERSPMEEHRQMIANLMQMQFIVAGVVQDVVSNAVQNAELNKQTNKVKKEKIDMSSYSEPSNSRPRPTSLSESPDSPSHPPALSEDPDSLSHPPVSPPHLSAFFEAPDSQLPPPDFTEAPDSSFHPSSLSESSDSPPHTPDSPPHPLDSAPLPPDSTPLPPDSTPLPPDSTPLPPDSTPHPPDSTPHPPDSPPHPPDSPPHPPDSPPHPPDSPPHPPDSPPHLPNSPFHPPDSTHLPPDSTPLPPVSPPHPPYTDGEIIETMDQLEAALSSGDDFKLLIAPELLETEAFKIFMENYSLALNTDLDTNMEEERKDAQMEEETEDVDVQASPDKQSEDRK